MKLRALGYWLGFHNFSKQGFHDWCRRHGCATRVIGWGRRAKAIFSFTTNAERAKAVMAAIREDMGDRFLSVKPEDIPGFPDETLDVMRLDLAEKDRDALDRAYAEMPDQYRQLSEDEMVQTLRLREQAEWCKAEAIAEMAVGFESDGLSVFILVNFTDARLRIEKYLADKGVAYASIYGGQKDAERQKGIDAFQRNDIHVLVAMAAAASCALSAHDERHERPRVSLISPGYNASDVKQGLGRIRRVNGTKAVQHFVLAAESVEERVAKTLERKLANIDSLNDGDLLR
jgi:SNF2 family DNA or RNA helicase